MKMRLEQDYFGQYEAPFNAYYGIQKQPAMTIIESGSIGRIHSSFVWWELRRKLP
jgi:aspartate ammonia-lyase